MFFSLLFYFCISTYSVKKAIVCNRIIEHGPYGCDEVYNINSKEI